MTIDPKKMYKNWATMTADEKVEALAAKHRPHKLKGEWDSFHECHITPDWLLIYLVTDDRLILVRTGTHSDLFG